MFSFDQPGFLGRLLRGTMLYWMAPFETEGMVSAYAVADRSVWVQELALTRAQREELRALLALNALPENRFYRYDYYRDNCSTRVRDALDRVLDGRLRTALAGIATGTTHRWHTRRLLRQMPAMYTGIQLLLSGKADRPIDRWEEAFLPDRADGGAARLASNRRGGRRAASGARRARALSLEGGDGAAGPSERPSLVPRRRPRAGRRTGRACPRGRPGARRARAAGRRVERGGRGRWGRAARGMALHRPRILVSELESAPAESAPRSCS